MANNNDAFTIDDTLGTSDNLDAYARSLEAMDAPLGAVLSPYLASLAASQAVDTSAIWNALFAAAAPVVPDPTPPIDEVDGDRSAI